MWTRCGFVADCLEPIKGFFTFYNMANILFCLMLQQQISASAARLLNFMPQQPTSRV